MCLRTPGRRRWYPRCTFICWPECSGCWGTYAPASIVAALAINSVFSALTCIPVFLLSLRCFPLRAAKWAGWGWAFSPYGIYYGADWAWSTCLVTLLLAVLFLWALALEESGGVWDWLGFGALGGVAALTEPVVLSVVPLLGLWTCWRRSRRRRSWVLPMTVAALGALAVMAPWLVHNYETFHQFIPIRSGFGLELYIGNSADTRHWVDRSLHPNHSDRELAEYTERGELAYMQHKTQQAKQQIRSYPAQYVYRVVRRIIYIWTGFWSFDRAYLAEEPLDVPNIFLSTTMTVLALGGLRRVWRGGGGGGGGGALAVGCCVRVFSAGLLFFASGDVLFQAGGSADCGAGSVFRDRAIRRADTVRSRGGQISILRIGIW